MTEETHEKDDTDETSHAEVLRALRGIDASAAFAHSAGHRRLLRHLVECWLAGDLAQLREIALGVTVFGRPAATFDPTLDSIVRVEARRLRARLARYYAGEGAASRVAITLVAGSYVPSVRRLSSSRQVEATGQAADAVVRVRSGAESPVADVAQAMGRFLGGTYGIRVASDEQPQHTLQSPAFLVELDVEGANAAGAASGVRARLIDERSGAELVQVHVSAPLLPGSVDRIAHRLSLSVLRAGLEVNWCPAPVREQPEGVTDENGRDCFHRARMAFRQRSIAGYRLALQLFESLLASGSEGAEIHAGVARCCVALAGMLDLPVREAMPRARLHAGKALVFDAASGDGHCVIAQVASLYDRDWPLAEKHFLKAIQRTPRNPSLHHAYAFGLMYQGRFDEAEQAYEFSLWLDPLDVQVRIQRWLIPYYQGHYEVAIHGWQDLLAIAPDNLLADTLIGAAHLAAGRPALAMLCYERARERMPQHPIGYTGLAQAYALAGRMDDCRDQLARVEEIARNAYVSPYLFAMIHMRLGDSEAALHWLQRSAAEPDFNFVCASVDPTFGALHRDPRWPAFCADTRLPRVAG